MCIIINLIFYILQKLIKLLHCSFRNSPIHFGEEIEFSFLLVENLTVSPQGLSSILRFPCGEIIENSFLLNENSNSSPRRWEKLWSELCINCKYFRIISSNLKQNNNSNSYWSNMFKNKFTTNGCYINKILVCNGS